MTDAKKPAVPKPISDVAPPGKSAPDPTSRPVIINNRPLLKDPMMIETPTEKESSESSTGQLTKPNTAAKAHLKPPTDDTEPELVATEEKKVPTIAELAAAGAKDKPPSDQKTAEPVASAETDAKPADQTPKDETADSNAADSDEPAKPTDSEIDAEAEAQAKHDTAIQKLIDGKQYFLPINTVEKRRSKHFVILGVLLSILLILAWADIALDAGLIHVANVKPLTHFFSN